MKSQLKDPHWTETIIRIHELEVRKGWTHHQILVAAGLPPTRNLMRYLNLNGPVPSSLVDTNGHELRAKIKALLDLPPNDIDDPQLDHLDQMRDIIDVSDVSTLRGGGVVSIIPEKLDDGTLSVEVSYISKEPKEGLEIAKKVAYPLISKLKQDLALEFAIRWREMKYL